MEEEDTLLSNQEQEILFHLVNAWNLYIKIANDQTLELTDFCDGIRKCQYVIAMHIARKAEPDIFGINNLDEEMKNDTIKQQQPPAI